MSILILTFLFFLILFLLMRFGFRKPIIIKKKENYINTFDFLPKKYVNTVTEKVYMPEERNLITYADFTFDDLDQTLSKNIKPVYLDSQNVHDSYLQNSLSKDFKLSEINPEKCENKIISFANNDPEIIDVVEKIKKRNIKMIKYNNSTEFDILCDTFEKGDDNVKNQIILVLRSWISDIPCCTGVVSNIREASFINTPERIPVHKNTLQQLMLSKASTYNTSDLKIIREKLITEYSSIYLLKDIEKIIDDWGEIF